MRVEDLDVEVSSSDYDTKCIEDIQEGYDRLVEEFLKENKRVHALSTRLKSSVEEKQALHADLMKSKAQICGLEEENNSMKDK
ncbi:unnamed protein product, partial [Ilex paraguariensis]